MSNESVEIVSPDALGISLGRERRLFEKIAVIARTDKMIGSPAYLRDIYRGVYRLLSST